MIKWNERWPDFRVEEILSPMQLRLLETRGVFPYTFRALDKLQAFRKFVNLPFLINHGDLLRRGARSMQEAYDINYATRARNRKTGEVDHPERAWEYSFHLWCAFDISVEGMTSLELFSRAMEFGQFGGIGLYDHFVHVDDRDSLSGEKSTWDARVYPPKATI